MIAECHALAKNGLDAPGCPPVSNGANSAKRAMLRDLDAACAA
jgi:hypothetical protein